MVRLALKVLLAWTALSVPVGVLAGKVLKARREEMEAQARPVPPGNRGPPDRPGSRASPVKLVPPDHLDPPDL